MTKYQWNHRKMDKNSRGTRFALILFLTLLMPSVAPAGGGDGNDDDQALTVSREHSTLPPKASELEVFEESQKPSRSKYWTEFLLGGATGIVEVSVNQPIVYLKNCVQQRKKPLWTKPSVWYRGYCVNAGSMAPITAIQMGANSILGSFLRDEEEPELSDEKKVFVSVLAGMISAVVSSPAELAMIQQQNSGTGLWATVKEISMSGRSSVFRGLIPTAARDGKFTAGYITVAPLVQRQMGELVDSERSASVLGGMVTGAGVAVLTQPWDMVKTAMQSNRSDSTLRETMRKLYQEGGVIHFWRGGIARGTRVVLAITLMNEFQREMRNYLD